MNGKTIAVLAGIVVIIVVGAYIVFRSSTETGQPPANQVNTAQPGGTQVQAQDISVGTGQQAVPGSTVSVLYIGKLQNGTIFDSSEMHGNQPLTFQLGSQGLIPGFQIGVNGMKIGGERIMAVPPSLGYGAQEVKDASGKVVIPANSTIIFDVKLVAVQASTSTPVAQPRN